MSIIKQLFTNTISDPYVLISLVRSGKTFEEHSEEGKEETTTKDEEGTLMVHDFQIYSHDNQR